MLVFPSAPYLLSIMEKGTANLYRKNPKPTEPFFCKQKDRFAGKTQVPFLLYNSHYWKRNMNHIIGPSGRSQGGTQILPADPGILQSDAEVYI